MYELDYHIRTENKQKKWFSSVPGGVALLPIWVVGILFFSYMVYHSYDHNESYFIILCFCVWVVACFVCLIISVKNSICFIRFSNHGVECIRLFNYFSLEYEKCVVGLDYSWRGNQKIWWIYLCEGEKPRYKNEKNRMNAMPCKPGFVRMIYRENLCKALIALLPKKQKTAFVSEVRCKLKQFF